MAVAEAHRAMSTAVLGAERLGKQLAVVFNYRYISSFRYVKHVIDKGVIARRDHVRILGGHDGLFRAVEIADAVRRLRACS